MAIRIPVLVLCCMLMATALYAGDPEQYFVKFVDNQTRKADMQWLASMGVRVTKEFKSTDAVLCDIDHRTDAALKAMRLDPRVEYIEPNRERTLCYTPNDQFVSNQWSLNNTGQAGGIAGADISAFEAWDHAVDLEEVLVAIVDSGIDYTHPDLQGVMWDGGPEYPYHGYDIAFSDDDPMPEEGGIYAYHGTHVAGIVAAQVDNAVGIAGVAPNASIVAIKVSDGGPRFTVADVIDAFDLCIEIGVDVVNASFGHEGHSTPELESINGLAAAGIVLVAAVGNDGEELSDENEILFYPACYDADNIISVASSDRFDNLSDFSNYGFTTVDLAAPGSTILSTLLEHGYGDASGTSMAAPHVAGAVALLLGAQSGLTPSQVRATIMDSATRLPQFARTTISGGRLNMYSMFQLFDTTQPADISDLTAVAVQANSLTLTWTATGDDGHSGQASQYDLRYSTAPIVEFETADRLTITEAPPEPGAYDTYLVDDLIPDTHYYFALRIGDSSDNWSSPAYADGMTISLSTAHVDTTGSTYSCHTGERLTDLLPISNVDSGSLAFLMRATSTQPARSMARGEYSTSISIPVGEHLKPESGAVRRRVPRGESKLSGLLPSSPDKGFPEAHLFHEDFNTDNGAWSVIVDEGTNLWGYSDQAYTSPGASIAFSDSILGGYDTGSALDVSILSSVIDLASAEGDVTLEFFEWYDTEIGYDFCDVQVQVVATGTWYTVRSGASGHSDGWVFTCVDLTPFIGESIIIRLRFHTTDEIANDYAGWWVDDIVIRDDGCSWLSFLYSGGHVAPNTTLDQKYMVDCFGLCDGILEAEIQVFTNDPEHRMMTTPIEIIVQSAADIQLEEDGPINLGTAFLGYQESRTIWIYNKGCSTLEIESTQSGHPDLGVDVRSPSVAPGDSVEMTLILTPSAAGPVYGSISLATNDPDEKSIDLFAYGTGEHAPDISVSATEPELYATGYNSVEESIVIRNEGLGALEWHIGRGEDAVFSMASQKRVLVSNGTIMANVCSHILTTHPDWELDYIPDVAPPGQLSSEILNEYDIVILSPRYNYENSELDAVVDWTERGGSLVMDVYHGMARHGANYMLQQLGTESRTSSRALAANTTTSLIMDHDITDEVSEVRFVSFNVFDPLADPLVPLVSHDVYSDALVCNARVGSGRYVVLASNLFIGGTLFYADNMSLVDNLVRWLAEPPIDLDPDGGTIPPGGEQALLIRYSAADACEGQYEHPFSVIHTDPSKPDIEITPHIDVEGIGELYADTLRVELGTVFAAGDTSRVVEIWNMGNGPVGLHADIGDSAMLLEPSEFTVSARGSNECLLTLLPGPVGGYEGEIELISDDPAVGGARIVLSAHRELPVVEVAPSVFDTVQINTGYPEYVDFSISNVGGWPLEYELLYASEFNIAAVGAPGHLQPIDPMEEHQLRLSLADSMCMAGVDELSVQVVGNTNTAPVEFVIPHVVVSTPALSVDYDREMTVPPINSDQFIDLENVGCEDLSIDNITISGEEFVLVPPELPCTIPPGEHETMRLFFFPPGQGEYTCYIEILSNDPVNSLFEFHVNGTSQIGPPKTSAGGVVAGIRNTPNPFNPMTVFLYRTPVGGNAEIVIYNVRGQPVRTLELGDISIGEGDVQWNGKDGRGQPVASGVYFCRLYVDGRHLGETGRAVLVR